MPTIAEDIAACLEAQTEPVIDPTPGEQVVADLTAKGPCIFMDESGCHVAYVAPDSPGFWITDTPFAEQIESVPTAPPPRPPEE